MGSSRTEIGRMQRKRDSSNTSSVTRHIRQNMEFNNPVVGCGAIFSTDYLSRRGKWLQMTKLLTIIFIPILGGWAFTFTALMENIDRRGEIVYAQDMIQKSVFLGNLIYHIQQERDMSILYISRVGPGTKTFLMQRYDATDRAFSELWKWPEEFAADDNKVFRTKKQLMSYINIHRASVSPDFTEVYDEISFYSQIIDFLIEWMITTIRESGFGIVWRSLIVFHKLSRCMLDMGAERAYGTMFFARGNFPNRDFQALYFNRLHRFNYSYQSASFYSIIIDSLYGLEGVQNEVTRSVNLFRKDIKFSIITKNYTSYLKAEDYFDNCTLRIDYLYHLQKQVSKRIIVAINSSLSSVSTNIALYGVIVTVVLLACPLIIYFSELLVTNIQSYSKVLNEKTEELNIEQSKTTSLLYQMLPKPVADSLKKRSKVESEYFKSATVMFSSINNFTQMSIEYTALELIDILNELYTAIDERIEKYDVYKVETINDTYMVVSGVPIANGIRHASEIAAFGLNVLSMTPESMARSSKIKANIQLQLGASTGSVSAGVVGSVMLRYCLFGDTVNSASRMKSTGMPNSFHVSETTAMILKRDSNFSIKCRGSINVKGKGRMQTYWLLPSETSTRDSKNWALPGQVNDDSYIDEYPQLNQPYFGSPNVLTRAAADADADNELFNTKQPATSSGYADLLSSIQMMPDFVQSSF